MQEDERLLPQHDEDGVHQLRDLGHGEEVAPEAGDRAVGDVAVKSREVRRVRDHIPLNTGRQRYRAVREIAVGDKRRQTDG